MKAVLFVGSTRTGRMASRVAAFVQTHLKKKGFEVDVFDPVELKLPLIENPLHFMDPSKAPEWLLKLNERVLAADCYVLVSAEYNNCTPPALTNMINHFPPKSFHFKPSLIVHYSMGRLGGSVAGSQLRPFTSVLGCPSVPMALAVAEVHKSLDESGAPLHEYLDVNAGKAVDQLFWMSSALKNHKAKEAAPPSSM